MRFLYPSDPFNHQLPDEDYSSEYNLVLKTGFPVSLFSLEDFNTGKFKPRPMFTEGEVLCYRGWMLSLIDYSRLCTAIEERGGKPLTSPEAYKLCHYLPGWYELLSDYTPKTLFFCESDDVVTRLRVEGWTGCFLKDYVKSLGADRGSLVVSLETIPGIIEKMKKYRGQIEGGLCARQIEDFVANTECRYFVLRGKPHSHSSEIPNLVRQVAEVIQSPFYSVDVVQNSTGTWRIVELGDGQVSGLKVWTPETFVAMFKQEVRPC